MTMEIKFGTDGWRAIIGDQFTFYNVARVLQAYAVVLTAAKADRTKPIPIGYDRRFLSPEFARTAAAVLAHNGFKVKLAQSFCPTPAISCLTKEEGAPGGVVITASHNPYQWNGIKFKEGYGGSASPAFTTEVEKKIPALGPSKTCPVEEFIKEGRVVLFDPRPGYLRALRSQVDVPKILRASWKIAYDSLFGAGSSYLSAVLEGHVAETLHHEENPSFGGLNPEPIEKNLGDLMEIVKKKKLDVGLATDGDADRIGAVDESGNFVTPQQIFALLLHHLTAKGLTGAVIKTVSTTQMVDRIAERHGLTVYETPVGFKHICKKFLEVPCLIGGEESGGIGVPSHVYERDGLLSGLLLLEMMAERKKRLGELLSDLAKEIGPFVFLRDDLHLPAQQITRARELVSQKGGPAHGQNQIGPLKITRTDQTDGCKYYFENGAWLLFRTSGTEPLIRLYAEASSLVEVKNLLQSGRNLMDVSRGFKMLS